MTDDLLALIRHHEARGNYNIVYGGIRQEDRPRRALTLMTIADVIEWQRAVRVAGARSTAAGAYQFIYNTLRGVVGEAGLSISDRFSEENQDRLAIQLLRRRGLDKYQRGEMSTADFANNIAKEWASMPVVTPIKGAHRTLSPGQSYYAGDGLNKAHASVEELLEAVRSVKPRPSIETPPQVRDPNPLAVLVILVAGGLAFFGRRIWDFIKRRMRPEQ